MDLTDVKTKGITGIQVPGQGGRDAEEGRSRGIAEGYPLLPLWVIPLKRRQRPSLRPALDAC